MELLIPVLSRSYPGSLWGASNDLCPLALTCLYNPLPLLWLDLVTCFQQAADSTWNTAGRIQQKWRGVNYRKTTASSLVLPRHSQTAPLGQRQLPGCNPAQQNSRCVEGPRPTVPWATSETVSSPPDRPSGETTHSPGHGLPAQLQPPYSQQLLDRKRSFFWLQ